MYSKTAIAAQKKSFFIAFGRYMSPVPSVFGEPVSWLNYRTGVKHIYFRIELAADACTVGLYISGAEPEKRQALFDKLQQFTSLLPVSTSTRWHWQPQAVDENGQPIARVAITIGPVHFMQTGDWPAIIAFLKEHLLQLDHFWFEVKEFFHP